jgi:ketosteroid isomerase-like protein
MELWRIRDGKVVELRPFLYDAAALAAALEP